MADFAVSKAGIRLEMWPKSQEKLIMFEHMICFKPSWLSGSMEINKLFPLPGLDFNIFDRPIMHSGFKHIHTYKYRRITWIYMAYIKWTPFKNSILTGFGLNDTKIAESKHFQKRRFMSIFGGKKNAESKHFPNELFQLECYPGYPALACLYQNFC